MAQRISAADARIFVEELETGRGRLAALARRNPRLIDISQEALGGTRGDPIPMFRHIMLRQGEELRSEDVASCTLRPEYALKLAQEAPGVVMTRTAFIVLKPVLLRYAVPLQRVLLYIPAAMDVVEAERPEALAKMRVSMRSGERPSGLDVIRLVRALNEEEVVADLSDLAPITLELPRTRDIYYVHSWLRRDTQDDLERARYEDRTSMALSGEPGGEEDRLKNLWAQCELFFRP